MSNVADSRVALAVSRRPRHYVVFVMSVCLGLMLLFILGLAVGHSGLVARHLDLEPASGAPVDSFRVFWEAWEHIEQQFYMLTSLDSLSMTRGAVSGMLASLEDPYTLFVESSQRRLETDRLEGKFGGIGVSLGITNQQVVIASVYAGAPAERAGLQAGDVLLSVDGTEVAGLSVDQAVLLIRGALGSSVQLRVRRNGQEDLVFTMAREQIDLPSLTWRLLPDSIAYIHIYQFTGRTGDEFSDAVRLLQTSTVRGLVLDLRGNGGGLVDSAVRVLGKLVGHGISYREVSKKGERRHAIPFEPEPIDWPLAVLVDETSASAAEIVASALQDHGRGLLFGETTFGKGSMQGIFPLSDGSSVHVTTAQWLSPDGHPIQGGGVQPDIRVHPDDSEASADLVLQQALEYLQCLVEVH